MRMRRVVLLITALAGTLTAAQAALTFVVTRPIHAAAPGWWGREAPGEVCSVNLRNNGNGTVYLRDYSTSATWEAVSADRVVIRCAAGATLTAKLEHLRDDPHEQTMTIALKSGQLSFHRPPRRHCYLSSL